MRPELDHIAPHLPGPAHDALDAEQFSLIVEHVVDYAIFLLDHEGRVASWNQGAARIKGHSRKEIIGRPYSDFFLEEDRQAGKPARLLARARAEGRCEDEGWRARKDGSRFWASAVITALRDRDGALRGYAKITRDLTERRKAEEAARELARVEAAAAQARRDAAEREALRRRHARLANLRTDVGTAAAYASDVWTLLDRCAHALVEHLEVPLAQAWLLSPEGELRLAVSRGTEARMGVTIPEVVPRGSALGAVLGEQRAQMLGSLAAVPNMDWASRLGLDACAACPMASRDTALGVLAVFGARHLPEDVLEGLAGAADVVVHCMERLRAEAEVRRSRDQLELILGAISEGVIVQSVEGRFVYANDAAARLCGFPSARELLATPRAEILGRFEILRDSGEPFPQDELPGRLAARGATSRASVRFKAKGAGEERWSFVSAAPVTNAQGDVELAVSVLTDYTDAKRTERAWEFLAQASAELGASLDYEATLKRVAELAVPNMADWAGVDVLGQDGLLQQLAVAHVDPSKVGLARELRRRWPPGPQSASYQVVATGTPQLISEVTDEMIEAGTPDPEHRAALRELGLRSAMIVPLVGREEPFGVLSFVAAESGRRYGRQDLIVATEIGRRASLAIENSRLYAEARAAVAIRDTFLSVASHELRTPLATMNILNATLARAARHGKLASLGEQGLLTRLEKADRQGRHLAALVDRLLDVSRLSKGELALERTVVNLTEVAQEVIARFEETTDKHVALGGQTAVAGVWDRSRIDQVVTNLVSNALKYGTAPVEVEIGAAAGRAWLVVRDGGPGISREDLARIWNQFERAAPRHIAGMGLGLWIVRRIVEAHGGEVTLTSEPGRGTAFMIHLPLEPGAGGTNQ